MKVKPAARSLTDTARATAAVQIQVLRGMSPRRKVGLVEDANRTARCLALAGIGLRYPGSSQEERIRLLMNLLLGQELAGRVYGPGPTGPDR